ncbi:hypothetical protein NEAUS03_1104 [Nematocida ausubeli]|nr:hypothetical protein NEAUS03_1104 [Nematocida ausubeli]
MEQFAVDDLVIKLMAKRKEVMHTLYTAYSKKIEKFLQDNPGIEAMTIEGYLNRIEEKNKEREELLQKNMPEKERKRKQEIEQDKRRKSMIVTFDDMSFSFGKEELEQLSGKEKPVDPEVKNILEKMNSLFKQLGKTKEK